MLFINLQKCEQNVILKMQLHFLSIAKFQKLYLELYVTVSIKCHKNLVRKIDIPPNFFFNEETEVSESQVTYPNVTQLINHEAKVHIQARLYPKLIIFLSRHPHHLFWHPSFLSSLFTSKLWILSMTDVTSHHDSRIAANSMWAFEIHQQEALCSDSLWKHTSKIRY